MEKNFLNITPESGNGNQDGLNIILQQQMDLTMEKIFMLP
jgi:hypothetical protein